MQTEIKFVTQLLGMTEAFLGTIKAYKYAYILPNESIEIPQYEVSFLMYLVWSYVEKKNDFHPTSYNPEFLFLKSLSCQKKSNNHKTINWNQFINRVKHSEEPLKEINERFKTCDSQTFFDVNLKEVGSWQSEIKQIFLLLLREDIAYGKSLQSIYFFVLISILSEYLRYNDESKIDLYIKLLCIFKEYNFQESLKRIQIEFPCLNSEFNTKLEAFRKCKDNFVDNFAAMLGFDDDAINALENIAGNFNNYGQAFFNNYLKKNIAGNFSNCGQAFFDNYLENERLSFLDFDFRAIICIASLQEEKPLRTNDDDLGSKYENFCYWLEHCIYNGDM